MRWLLLVLLAACPAGKKAPVGPTGSAERLAGFVLVPRDARLYSDASADAPHARPHVDEADKPPWPMAVVEDKGDFVVVETLVDEGAHCYPPDVDLPSIGLRLRTYVRRADLRTTTTRELTVDYPDGASVRLAAGVALATGQTYQAASDSLTITTMLPDDAVGLSYLAPGAFAEEDGTYGFGGPHTLGAGAKSAELGGQAWAVEEGTADGMLSLKLVTRCAQVRTRVPENTLQAGVMLGELGGTGMRGCDHCPRAEDGTKLYYPDGREAGQVVGTLWLDLWTNPTEEKGLSCGDQFLRWPENDKVAVPREWTVHLCVRAEDVH